ncbi:TetR/AcrR family transcriptional regulator [Streptacidiphilus sp. PAMC 29251]
MPAAETAAETAAAPAGEQTIASVWTRPRRPQRQPSALGREQIVAEAVALLDEEGIAALSMRKLGARLGSGATSIYWHVPSKDELVELVVDEVYGELRAPDLQGADAADPAVWRAATVEYARSVRAMVLRHTWVGGLLGESGLSYLGPNMMRLSDGMLGLYRAAGFTLLKANDAITTVTAYVLGMATGEAAMLTTIARSGVSEQEWVAALLPTAERAAQPYPHLRELYVAYRAVDPEVGREDGFGYGLERILDGLQAEGFRG